MARRRRVTALQVEVLQAVADGMQVKMIARQRNRAYSTVRTELVRLRAVLKAENLQHAVAIGFRRGLLT